MDTRLNTFLILCETMNYRKAAEKLHISQPAVTKQIQSLENEYGIKLFEFDGRKLNRTEKSYLLEVYANSQRANYQNIVKRLREKDTYILRIGLTKTIGEVVIFDEILNYMDNNRDDLELIIDNTDNLFQMLSNNRLDFLVIEGNFDKEKYNYKLFSEELFTGICSKEHPFANREIAVGDIFGQNLIAREEGSGSRDILESLLNLQSYSLTNFSRRVFVSSVHLIKSLVKEDLGITFAYENLILKDDSLTTFKVKELTTYHEFNVVGLKGTGGLKKAKNFLLHS